MGGVMVVYGPPITHSLPPAVGASRTSQFMISKGPAVAQSEHLSLWGARPSPPCAGEHMVWDLSDGRGLYLQTRTPREGEARAIRRPRSRGKRHEAH